MITNSVHATRVICRGGRQAAGPGVAARRHAEVAVLVWDGVPRMPVLREAGRDDETGRGLGIVAELTRDWDCYVPAGPFRGKVSRAFIGVTSNSGKG